MDNYNRCISALKYLLIKNNMIDMVAFDKYCYNKYSIFKLDEENKYQISYLDRNGTMSFRVRYPEYACYLIMDLLKHKGIRDITNEFAFLLSVSQENFDEITFDTLNNYEQSIKTKIMPFSKIRNKIFRKNK